MLERIRNQLGSLSAGERKVADLVLEQPYTMMQAAVADIPASAGVSQPTVIRFCRSMGCTGLPDFKLVDLAAHGDLIPVARDDAKLALEQDPELVGDRGRALRVLLYLFERDSVVRTLRSG